MYTVRSLTIKRTTVLLYKYVSFGVDLFLTSIQVILYCINLKCFIIYRGEHTIGTQAQLLDWGIRVFVNKNNTTLWDGGGIFTRETTCQQTFVRVFTQHESSRIT